jgi:hypothetical protein
MRSQIEAGPSVRRESKEKLVVLSFGDIDVSQLTYFSNESPDLRIARATLSGIHGQVLLCDLIAYDGHIVGFEFSAPPKVILSGMDFKCENVRIFADPMSSTPPDDLTAGTPGPALTALMDKYEVTTILLPPSEEEKRTFLAAVDAVLPGDYLQLLNESNYFVAGEVEFVGTNARTIVLPETFWFLLAESEQYAICASLSSKEGSLILYHQNNDDIEKAGFSFVQLLEEMIRLENEPED